MTAEPLTPDAVRAFVTDAMVAAAWRAHHIADWGDDLDPRDNGEAESGPIREALIAALPELLIRFRTSVHCPSCDGYQSAVMDDGQRSVGVCEGIAARTVETAEELWGVVLDDFGSTDYYDTRAEADEVRKRAPDTGLVRVVTTTIVSPTPEEADPEEVSRLSAKIIAREKPILDRLAAHDGTEEGDRG